MSTEYRLHAQRGISFIELVLFIVIVGVALAGILGVMNLATQNSADPLARKQALMLAEAYMEEVQLARFTYCDATDENVATATGAAGCASAALAEDVGPDAGETRPFDNVNDYVTAYGVPQQAFRNAGGTLLDASGTSVNTPGYSVALTIDPSALVGPAGARVPADAALKITVAVSANGVELVRLVGYRLRYAPNSPP